MTVETEPQVTNPYAGLSGREFVVQTIADGPECLSHLNETKKKWLAAICRRAGVEWPHGYFESDVETVFDNRFDNQSLTPSQRAFQNLRERECEILDRTPESKV